MIRDWCAKGPTNDKALYVLPAELESVKDMDKNQEIFLKKGTFNGVESQFRIDYKKQTNREEDTTYHFIDVISESTLFNYEYLLQQNIKTS